jgi:hypothetical protein
MIFPYSNEIAPEIFGSKVKDDRLPFLLALGSNPLQFGSGIYGTEAA